MPILGLVLQHAHPDDLSGILRFHPAVTQIGAPLGVRLPVVAETSSPQEDERLLEQLWALPGVVAVDIAFVDFSDLTHPEEVLP